jgi:hypothetical protein
MFIAIMHSKCTIAHKKSREKQDDGAGEISGEP